MCPSPRIRCERLRRLWSSSVLPWYLVPDFPAVEVKGVGFPLVEWSPFGARLLPVDSTGRQPLAVSSNVDHPMHRFLVEVDACILLADALELLFRLVEFADPAGG